MTITHATPVTAGDDAAPQHETLTALLGDAAMLPRRPGLTDTLALISTADRHGALTPELAHRLGMQLRLLAGPAPLDDDDLDGHLLLQTIVFELAEIAATVDGVHVDDLAPHVERLLDAGAEADAQRLLLLTDAARSRVRTLLSPLAVDLGAA